MKEFISRAELKFWTSVIVVVIAVIVAFQNLKNDVALTNQAIEFIKRDVAEIKSAILPRSASTVQSEETVQN